MEGLKYLEKVVLEERQLLHSFMKDHQFVRDLLAKPNEYQGQIKNGEIEVNISRAFGPSYEYDLKKHTVTTVDDPPPVTLPILNS